MVGRTLGKAFWVLATWAVLFAPGAAAADPAAGVGSISSDDVAAAIIAPTMGHDGVVVAGSCRDGISNQFHIDCRSPAGHQAPIASPRSDHRGSTIRLAGDPGEADVEPQQNAPTRAPPSD